MASVQYVPDVGALWDTLQAGPLADPVSILLFALGGLLLAVSLAVFGGLSLGGLFGLISRSATG